MADREGAQKGCHANPSCGWSFMSVCLSVFLLVRVCLRCVLCFVRRFSDLGKGSAVAGTVHAVQTVSVVDAMDAMGAMDAVGSMGRGEGREGSRARMWWRWLLLRCCVIGWKKEIIFTAVSC